MTYPTSRRQPYPYDAVIGTTPVMLLPNQEGIAKTEKLDTLADVRPLSYEYGSQPPYIESTFEAKRLVGGMGERIQTTRNSTHYRYALNADLSISGIRQKGPLFHVSRGATNVGPVINFVVGPNGAGGDALLVADGPDLYTKSGGGVETWTLAGSMPAAITSMVRFKDAVSAVDALYVACADGTLKRWDGTTMTTVTLPAAPNNKAVYLEKRGQELWRAWDNKASKTTVASDPTVAASWGAALTAGDNSTPITSIRQAGGELFVFKTNGVFTFNTDSTDNELFPGLRNPPNAENGKRGEQWLDYVWFRYGDGFWRLNGQAQMDPIGPERMIENDSEVHGIVQGFAGWSVWFGFMGVYNQANGCSYLLKYGAWENPNEANPDNFVFSEVLHGAIKKWAGKQLTSLKVVSGALSGATNDALYVGFSDGSIEYCLLPKGTPDPSTAGSGAEYTTETGYVYWPIHHALFQADYKTWHGLSAFGPKLDANNYVWFQYNLDNQGWNVLSDINGTKVLFTATGQRQDFQSLNVFSRQIEVIECLDSLNGLSPIVEGTALHEQVRPMYREQYTLPVKAENYLPRYDGLVDRRDALTIREALKTYAKASGLTPIMLPDGSQQQVSITHYSEVYVTPAGHWGFDPGWHITIQGVQFRTDTLTGTVDRLGPYTVDDLGNAVLVDTLGVI